LVWKEVGNNQFSMPFLYDIKRPENSVIITKSGNQSPLLADLKNSDYAQKNINYLLNTKSNIIVLNFGTELSPLWRSLHELRLIEYNTLPLAKVANVIHTGAFKYAFEDSTTVSLIESNISIVKNKITDSTSTANAPDHLLRMFGYNDILRKIGKKYFEKEKYETALFRAAEEAYVVTPISSMIVLESKADYDRMGINKNKNTVGNAQIEPGGGVPEPHEWLLITLVFILIAKHLYQKHKFSTWRFQ
jgi:XrtN system VIT domain protein